MQEPSVGYTVTGMDCRDDSEEHCGRGVPSLRLVVVSREGAVVRMEDEMQATMGMKYG